MVSNPLSSHLWAQKHQSNSPTSTTLWWDTRVRVPTFPCFLLPLTLPHLSLSTFPSHSITFPSHFPTFPSAHSPHIPSHSPHIPHIPAAPAAPHLLRMRRCWRAWSLCASAPACTSATQDRTGCTTWCTRSWTTPSMRWGQGRGRRQGPGGAGARGGRGQGQGGQWAHMLLPSLGCRWFLQGWFVDRHSESDVVFTITTWHTCCSLCP